MKIEVEPTGTIVVFDGVTCRLWQGKSDGGAVVELLVARLVVKSQVEGDVEAIDEVLQEKRRVTIDDILARAFRVSGSDEDDGPDECDDE